MSSKVVVQKSKIDPKFFTLLIACASIFMMFAGLTSAYVVRQAGGNWLEFTLPDSFTYSTIIIIISSVFLHFSYFSINKGKEASYKIFLVVAFIMGLFFLVLQYYGWTQMENMGIMFIGNLSGSFVYVISAVHAAHVLGGIGALAMAMIHALSLDFFVNDKRRNRFKITVTYWHFVDILWLYLFLFFTVQRY